MNQQDRILARAVRFQRNGHTQTATRCFLLACEIDTLREVGPVIKHTPDDHKTEFARN